MPCYSFEQLPGSGAERRVDQCFRELARVARRPCGALNERLDESAVEDDHELARQLCRVGGAGRAGAGEHPTVQPGLVPPDDRVCGVAGVGELG